MIKLPIHISSSVETIDLTIVSVSSNDTISVLDESEALANGEACYQILEGCSYEYEINNGYRLEEIGGIISTSKLRSNAGRITPNIYVGTLAVNVLTNNTFNKCGEFKIEVQSVKATYREDYRFMLEEIAEKSASLLMIHTSPVAQTFTIDFERNSETAYQRFAFINSIIDSEEFESAVHKIISSPTTRWLSTLTEKNIQLIKRLDSKIVRQFATSSNRLNLSINHPLSSTLSTLPNKIQVTSKKETVDTPENRFIKFALESFLAVCGDFSQIDSARVKKEALRLEEKLEQYLSSSIFKNISNLSSLPHNNPVLQRKEGYREVYRSWILFDLAAKLIWSGGEDVYSGNKRDVATLYEYWLFFKLIEIVTEVFELSPVKPEDLIEETSDGLGLKIKQGEYLAIDGVSNAGKRKLIIQLNYNRTYSGNQNYPNAGSWSRNLRPDYTLSIWPYGINYTKAEEDELIVHIHFDAKYKVESFHELYSNQVELNKEKIEERKGTYKRADLLKMHTYKDAIRRTAGAYVLYPGSDVSEIKKGFHEIVPGLGAFAIRPLKVNSGVDELKSFLKDVTLHLMNRASQRERISFKSYEVYKDVPTNEVNESLPEAIGANRSLIPDETFVLIGYYKNAEQLEWIEKSQLYNARTGSARGTLHLSPKETGAKYLLLHSAGETITSKLFKLSNKGPVIFSKNDLVKKDYPTEPSQEFYLVYEIEETAEQEFKNLQWDITTLSAYKPFRQSPFPFASSLAELMRCVKRE